MRNSVLSEIRKKEVSNSIYDGSEHFRSFTKQKSDSTYSYQLFEDIDLPRINI